MTNTIRSTATRAIAAGLVLALHASAAQGQAPPSDTTSMLPRELVEALVQPYNGGSRSAEFFVGKVPPTLQPFLFIPPGAQIIGAMTSPTSTTVVMTTPLNPVEVTAQYQREQAKLGWTRPPTLNEMRGWGFGPPPSATPEGSGLEFCHVGQSLQITPVPTRNGSTRVVATV